MEHAATTMSIEDRAVPETLPVEGLSPRHWKALLQQSPVICRVNGISMEPTLRSAWRILVEPLPDRPLRRGEIAAFWRNGILLVHRYLGNGRFQGDALPYPDGYVPPEHVVGIVRSFSSESGQTVRIAPLPPAARLARAGRAFCLHVRDELFLCFRRSPDSLSLDRRWAASPADWPAPFLLVNGSPEAMTEFARRVEVAPETTMHELAEAGVVHLLDRVSFSAGTVLPEAFSGKILSSGPPADPRIIWHHLRTCLRDCNCPTGILIGGVTVTADGPALAPCDGGSIVRLLVPPGDWPRNPMTIGPDGTSSVSLNLTFSTRAIAGNNWGTYTDLLAEAQPLPEFPELALPSPDVRYTLALLEIFRARGRFPSTLHTLAEIAASADWDIGQVQDFWVGNRLAPLMIPGLLLSARILPSQTPIDPNRLYAMLDPREQRRAFFAVREFLYALRRSHWRRIVTFALLRNETRRQIRRRYRSIMNGEVPDDGGILQEDLMPIPDAVSLGGVFSV